MKHWLIYTIIAAALLYGLAVDSSLDLNGDSPRFVMLARSIHDGQGYWGRFGVEDHRETQVPYLYPLMLLPLVSLWGPAAFISFKLLSVAMMLLALWSMWFWLSSWMKPEEARWVVLIGAFLGQTQLNADHIATEASFLAASFACLGFMERAVQARTQKQDMLLAVVFVGISFHLRAAGWSLLATMLLSFFLRRRWKDGMTSAALGLAVCSPWILRLVQYGLGYSAEFEQASPGILSVIYRFAYNIAADTTKALPDLFLFPFFSSYIPYERAFLIKAAIGTAIFILIGRGIWRYLRERPEGSLCPSEIYFVVYLVGALSWTVQGERYLLPVFPLLIWALLKGAGRWRRALGLVLIVVGVAGCLDAIYHSRLGIRSPEEAGFMQAVQWVGTHANPSDRVMSRFPTWVAAMTGNRGIRWQEADGIDLHLQEVVTNGIRWVVVDHIKVFRESATERLMPLIEHDQDHFSLVYETNQQNPTRVYRFNP